MMNLAPEDRVCICCNEHVPADEIQWDVFEEMGSVFCISCDVEDWLFDMGTGDRI